MRVEDRLKGIYFSYLDAYGHTLPALEVIHQLVIGGHTIVIYADEKLRELVEASGALFALYPDYENAFSAKREYIDFFKRWYESLTASIALRKYLYNELLEDIIAFNPQYIIYDQAATWGKEFAGYLNIPNICFFSAYAFSKEMLQQEKALIYDYYLGLKGLEINKQECEIERLNRALAITKKKYGNLEKTLSDFLLHKGDLNIVFYIKKFQICASIFLERYKEFDRKIEHFLSGRKCIYVSLGTDHYNNYTFFEMFMSYSIRSKYPLVVAVGSVTNEKLFKRKYENKNLFISSYVPQIQVLKNAVLFITHGGTGSVMEAVRYNVPLFVIPQDIDEFIIAKVIEDLGIGIRKYNDELKSCDISQIIEKIIQSLEIKRNMKALSDELTNINCANYTVALIEEYLLSST